MKKYLIHFISIDMPSIEDDGIDAGTGFGVYPQAFNSKEDAQKYLEKIMIPEDKVNLEECYGLDDEDCEPTVEIEIENGSYDRKELIVYDKHNGSEINTTIYKIVEVEL
jgi:hypothetical protein